MSATAATAAKKAIRYTSYWRIAGMTYLDTLDAATTALRSVLREPLRSDSLGKAHFKYRDFQITPDHKELPPVEVYSDPSLRKEK